MEKELNIAAILKDKPEGTKLWSPIVGDCDFSGISSKNGAVVVTFEDRYEEIRDWDFNEYGRTFSATKEAEMCLFPSKEMRDWSKFAWKKGDVLFCGVDNLCLFDKWANNQYTEFYGRYGTKNYSKGYDKLDTECWSKVNSKEVKLAFIKHIEEFHNGRLNLETLDIEQPNPEFKDGDIVVLDEVEDKVYVKCIIILKKNISYIDGDKHYYVLLNTYNGCTSFNNVLYDSRIPRLATDSEKQQLFDALAKEGKAWDAEKKAIVDLPKKCEFEPFQKVLVRCKDNQKWKVDFFSHYDDSCKGFPYVCVSSRKSFCIPYNDSTKHLLGTTDEWKGGEG